ncbi:MAG: PEP-CTERM sorting domain-containing protein [Microcystis sp.]
MISKKQSENKVNALAKTLSSLGILTGVTIAATTLQATSVSAATVIWADWTSATTGTSGSATGTIGPITVNYTGDVFFAQTVGGINYWNPALPYINNSVISNAPPASDIIALNTATTGSTTNKLTFSQPITNPIMAINSMGQQSITVSYTFNTPFNILSFNSTITNNPAYWGYGQLTQSGNTLIGTEGTGAIQFIGTYSSIEFSVDNPESWHGFTVGKLEQIPEPTSTLSLLALGTVGAASTLKRKLKPSKSTKKETTKVG